MKCIVENVFTELSNGRAAHLQLLSACPRQLYGFAKLRATHAGNIILHLGVREWHITGRRANGSDT